MSELERLIQELCPDGVEYSSIGSLITRGEERGKDNPDIKQVLVVSNTKGIVRAEEFRDKKVYSEDTSRYFVVRRNMFAYNPTRLNSGAIARVENDEAGLVSPLYRVFSLDESRIMGEYFNYTIRSSYVMGRIDALKEKGVSFRFDFSRWDWISIPVPPLEVQREIVRILNKFEEFNAALAAELAARQKQYTYYRDKLLFFEDVFFKEIEG